MEKSGSFRCSPGRMTLADLFGPLTTPTSALDFKDKVKITIKSNAGVKCLKVSKPCDPILPSGGTKVLKSCDVFQISLPSPTTGLEGATANPKPYLKMSPSGLPGGPESSKMEETKPAREALTCEEGRSSTTLHVPSIYIKKEPGICDTVGGSRIESHNGEESLSRKEGRGVEVDETQNNQNCTRERFFPNISVHIKEEPLTDEEEPSGHMSLNIKKEPVSDEEDNKSFYIKEEPSSDKEYHPSNMDETQILTIKIKEEPTSVKEELDAEDGQAYHIRGESCSPQAGGPSTSKFWLSSQRKDIILARTLPLVICNPQLTERKLARPKETKTGLLKKLMELGTPANEKTRTLTCTPVKMYKCSKCGRYFTSTQRLKRHHLAHKKYKVACPDCGRLFACKATVLRHQVVHSKEKLFPCSLCEKSFSTDKGREIHQRRHTGDKPFACSDCGKAFLFKAQLKTHQMIHTGERYSCNECGRCYRTKPGLVLHMRIHRGDLQYFCPECGRGFVHKSNLTNHLRSHSKEKPFACPQCGKGFGQKYTLNQHMKVHAAKERERYSCSECGKSYKRTADYRWHMLIHLGEK